MKKSRQWLKITLIMAGVIVLSFLIPGFLFQVQDRGKLSHIRTEKRDALDVAKLNLEYERDVEKRLQKFASTGQLYVTATDYAIANQNQAELADIYDQLCNQEWLDIVMYSVDASFPDKRYPMMYSYMEQYLVQESTATALKKYIICGDNANDGVIIMAWYVELTTEDGSCMKVLIDSETQTIYYMELSGGLDQELPQVPSKEDTIFSFMENVQFYMNYYYSSQIDASYLEMTEQPENANASTYDEYMKDTNASTDDNQGGLEFHLYTQNQGYGVMLDRSRGVFPLVYSTDESNNPEFKVEIIYNEKDTPTLSILMGLSKMEDYIPELSQEN